LTRSLAGSEAEAAFKTSVSNAVDKADNIMREFDQHYTIRKEEEMPNA
jgi:hypothetical protein